jgi:phosphoglycolate phosphatase
MINTVLFDLDGTFADTAPDLCHALNTMRGSRGLAPLPLAATRPVTSLGARGLLGVGFDLAPAHPDYAALREEFLDLYGKNLCRETRLFPGIAEALGAIEARGFRWGIVTNKAERYARPLIALLGYGSRAACIVGGDTTGRTKPDPAPLLCACDTLGAPPAACVYVGDDERDVVAGRAAGMRTVAVEYGYLNGSAPVTWGADALIRHPRELVDCIQEWNGRA